MSIASINSTPVDQMEALIEQHLLARIRLRQFRVLVQEQGLVLQGIAPTYSAKQLAQHAAMEVSGLRILANEIEVQ